jgi:hypothetical protein
MRASGQREPAGEIPSLNVVKGRDQEVVTVRTSNPLMRATSEQLSHEVVVRPERFELPT